MQFRPLPLLVASLLLTTCGQAVEGAPIDDALAVYNAGDIAHAVALLTPLAEADNVVAQDKLTHIYYWGELGAPDYEKSQRWAVRAALFGDPEAEEDLGVHYSDGKGVPRNVQIGIGWFALAAARGDTWAQVALAGQYLNGDGVPRDEARGVSYLRRAAGEGEPRAQVALAALMFAGSEGVALDVAGARKLTIAAAEQRSGEAQMMLSQMSGNPAVVVEWVALAAKDGCRVAKAETRAMFKRMPSVDVQEGLRLAHEWDDVHPARDPGDHRNLSAGPLCNVFPLPVTIRLGPPINHLVS